MDIQTKRRYFVTAPVEPDFRRRLRVLAAEKDTTVAGLIREALEKVVEEQSNGQGREPASLAA